MERRQMPESSGFASAPRQKSAAAALVGELKRQLDVLDQINGLIAIHERIEHLKDVEVALAAAQEARQVEADVLRLMLALRHAEYLIDEKEAMRRLKVSESTIKRMRADGSLPFVRVGVGEKLVRYRPSDIAAIIGRSTPTGQ